MLFFFLVFTGSTGIRNVSPAALESAIVVQSVVHEVISDVIQPIYYARCRTIVDELRFQILVE